LEDQFKNTRWAERVAYTGDVECLQSITCKICG